MNARHVPLPAHDTAPGPVPRAVPRRTVLRGAVVATTAAATLRPGLAVAAPPRAGGQPAHHGPGVLQDWYRTLYDVLMDEPGLTPGRAARIYGTAAVAAHEAVGAAAATPVTLAGRLNGLTSPPRRPNAGLDWPAVVSAAVAAAAADLLRAATEPSRRRLVDQLAAHVDARRSAGTPPAVVDRSTAYGQRIGAHVAAWARADGAEATVGRPYTPPLGAAMWRSTPPNFGTAIDPYWGEVRTMALPSADACQPVAPIAFDTTEGSPFHQQAMAVLAASDALDDAGRLTALFWRDNPVTSGLPSGHWMLLVAQLVGERGLDLAAGARVLAATGIALHDAFVSCWHEKYRTNLLRPVSYINAHVPGRGSWLSFVNTPQFPEYTSGHSVASQAAATVLTSVFGSFPFTDRTHLRRSPQLGSRSFGSFQDAAYEAAGSRLLGGIHYPMGIDVGLQQGEHVGRLVLERLRA